MRKPKSVNKITRANGILCVFLFVLLNFFGGYADDFKNSRTPIVLEIIERVGIKSDDHLIIVICKKNHIPLTAIYQWNNHLAIYGFLDKPDALKKQIADQYPGCMIKVYDHPFYNFNRKERCGKEKLAKEWDNVLLTADLVKNTKLQKEYLHYHATQFEKWPEVSQGFCNAGFQQLLVFKNGRQLMLVISIPKGESLDKLNSKTTKNNPKTVQWNDLMKKYQEGIPGTKAREVWVFLKPLI
ncbi:L-rhamnose mutarotase [Mucilaginibacter sp.]|uniref:L-rhamnose mutarotase n=1 Tax=Mucilaginibacter sp. TaxID=1882438 RepID=UPI0026108672|nr:L-rhamnose mutarotase [Mucilaginibacter sp.]MDB4919570.1 hypothetical protein [Mucilaginibacter sp.]